MAQVTLAGANIKITHNKQQNLKRFLEVIDDAATQGVDVLVFPEVALQGYADYGYTFFQPEFAEQRATTSANQSRSPAPRPRP